MEKTYDSFIELSPGYESVVDISSETAVKDFWTRYIVNDDMVRAVRLLSKSLKPEDVSSDVWHFWVKGAYGTGKTYSAIVLKHLLQDDYEVVEQFLTKNKPFAEVKDKFLSVRKKGRFYVDFRSGECKQLNTSNKFLFQIEQSVRGILRDNNFQYTGRNSLIDAVRSKTADFRETLARDFANGEYSEYWATYDSFDEFYEAVQNGDLDACGDAQEILQAKDIGLATDLDTFKAWLTDVFDGNPELKKTGMFIIWDEFTEYIRNNDLDIIQQLSIFSKQVPLFIIYVMHQYPGLLAEDTQANMAKADARFHKIDISLSEKTTLKLIGDSIITRDGMASNWSEICDELYATISADIYQFMPDPSVELSAADLKNIFPIHPMTVNLVSKVAGLAASNRSIFKFLKSSDDDGFRAYIKYNGPDGWKWVTPDYLWDYYFVKDAGGVKDLTRQAEDCLTHYKKVAHLITDDRALRIFKTAMLLLATVGSSRTMKKVKGGKGIQATEKTLITCFCGQISKAEIESYLTSLGDDLKVLALAKETDDRRIELPYTGGSDELATEIEKLKRDISITKLFDVANPFGQALKKQFVPEEKAVVKRLEVDTCWGTTQQLNLKLGKLQESLRKSHHRFGLLIVAVPALDEVAKVQATVNSFMSTDDTKRILVAIIRTPLTQEQVDTYYELNANANLAQRSGNTVNAGSFRADADTLIGAWVTPAIKKDILLVTPEVSSVVYANGAVLQRFEKLVFQRYPCAPETIIRTVTLYKSVSPVPAYYGVSRTTLSNKSMANDQQKNFNQQWQNIVDTLQNPEANVWDCTTVAEIALVDGTTASKSVAGLCTYLEKQLSSGTAILSDLWESIQKDLGYYDTSVCCYLLGFAFRFFLSKFTWNDGNNSHKLDENTVPTMIAAMCSGKANGMKLSSESDVEKRFKDISRRIFGLAAEEIGDIYDCRKNIRPRITKGGNPLWALKYLDESEYAGVKNEIIEIVDKYVSFVTEVGNQSEVMEETIALVKTNAKTYMSLLSSLLGNKQVMASGMRNFVFMHSEEAASVCDKYGFSIASLFKMVANSLEEEIWQWKEEEVIGIIDKLVLDLKLVGISNQALDGSAETIEKVRETLSNVLSYIRVPGCVYAQMSYDWAPCVANMYDISLNKWVSYSFAEKQMLLTELELHMKTALENVNNPIAVLRAYVTKYGLGTFSPDEYESILQALPKESYAQTENAFKQNLKKKIDDLAYSKKVSSIVQLWRNVTGLNSIAEWTATYNMPLVWAMPEHSKTFGTLLAVEGKERIDIERLDDAMTSLSQEDFTDVTDKVRLDKIFIMNVASEKYIDLLLPHVDELKTVISQSYGHPGMWQQNVVALRKITERFISVNLRSEVSDKAKLKAAKLTEAQLRAALTKVLEGSAEACLMLLDEQ